MSEAFKPLLNDTFIKVFLWLFLILGTGSLIWFLTYIRTNKEKNLKSSMRMILLTAISLSISLQMFFLQYRVGIIK